MIQANLKIFADKVTVTSGEAVWLQGVPYPLPLRFTYHWRESKAGAFRMEEAFRKWIQAKPFWVWQ